MSKTSKRAILTYVIIATFLISMIPIIPVIAATPEVEINSWPDDYHTWSLDTAECGIYSLQVTLDGEVSGEGIDLIAWLDEELTLADLTEMNFWEYVVVPAGTNNLGTGITLYIDMDDDDIWEMGTDDAQIVLESPYNDPLVTSHLDEWVLRDIADFAGFQKGGGALGNPFTGVDGVSLVNDPWADWKTSAYATKTLMGVGLVLGWGDYALYDGYLDDITVNGVTYPLEDVLPEQPDFSIDYITPGDIDYGDVLTVIGSGVTAGSEIIVYWDYATGTLIHPLNNTEGNPDGSYDLEVKVPSDLVGDHWLWVKDVATGATVKSDTLNMIPKIKLSPSSGLKNDDITIKGYGFAAESDIDITLGALSEDGGVEAAETDDLGYFEYKFEVDTDVVDTYVVWAEDEDGNKDSATFKLGASISIDPVEGPTGILVTVEGRGWADGDIITFREKGTLMAIEVVDDEVITVGTSGKFTADLVIPELGNEGDYDIEVLGSVSSAVASDGFELLGLPEIVVTPTYGTPGSIITVKGYNFTQIAGLDVIINLDGEELVIAETNSDGTFEDTFISPAVVFQTYDVKATDEYDLVATDPFKVGLIALIINPVYGEAGTKLSITGIGFADGDYNVTFGTILYEEYGDGVSDEAISDIFYVPNVLTGIYDITISDTDENEMTVEFRVTAVTEVTLDPAMAPNKYNVTIEGVNFADKDLEDVDFVLYNATDEWDMNVRHGKPTKVGTPVDTGADGNFTGWWEVLDEDTLSLGDYTINVTGYDDFLVQIPFSVVEARVSVAPRKALFDRGDSIQFNVKNDFDFPESYMKIWDPDDNLYWETIEFVDWVKSGDLYTVPYYMQTSGGNPMELSQDAPLGTWFYVFYETGTTQLTNGTFEVGPSVGPSAESLLTDQIAALSEELGIDIDTLRTYIDDLGIDMDEAVTMMAEDIAAAVSSMGADIAGLSEDLDDAVTGMQDDIDDMGTKMDSIETMVDDISETSGDAQQAANDAKTSADQATEAALQNQRQTSGLTGLVYGAIGASLIAALAAIVSLMQISRRIAG